MRRAAVLTVCLLLVLAGCNAVPDGGGTNATTTGASDATAGAETTDATGGEADLPPGLSDSGVTDADALAAAHEESLAGQPYTYDREVRVVAANGTELGRWSQHVQVGADRLTFNYTQTGEGVNVAGREIADHRVYTNGSVTFQNAGTFRDGYRRSSGRGFAENTFSSEQLLADVLNASETTVTEVERGGQTWYRVRAEGESDTFTYRVANGTAEVEATNVTATALVAPSGFVRNVTYEFDFARGNVSGHRTMTIRYSKVGETDVEVPTWVEDAKDAEAGNATSES